MRKIAQLLLITLCLYFAYAYFFPAPPAAPPAAPPPRPVAAPVEFADKASVRKLFDEWKSRTLGDPAGGHGVEGAPAMNADVELREIRRRLFGRGIHDPSAVGDVVANALRELGVKEAEIPSVLSGIMSMGRSE